MRLRPALMGTAGPPGLWLIDENDQTKFTITADGFGASPKQIEVLLAALADVLPEDGLEVPEI